MNLLSSIAQWKVQKAPCACGDLSPWGETLGDVVGLQMAYRAYRLSLGEKESDLIDGLTGDQRFFLGFAQIWRAMEREESLRNRVMTANHPPGISPQQFCSAP